MAGFGLRRLRREWLGLGGKRTFDNRAVAHDLALLMLDGQSPQDDAIVDKVINARTLFAA